ncbi:S-adenosyl-L-methionine-dependent methyltransferase [Gongronella butleri]|nr:S-adenosyl-L-methionine-dependent methyltransferase [Gongronella butleri]
MPEPIRLLEFFSGIGGLHYALNIAGVDAQVVEAFDTNQVANKVYEHNFGKKVNGKTIERLTVTDIDRYNADGWLLSPPCQPYTQGGKMMDNQDPRAKPLMHLIALMPKLKKAPQYLFLENVKNFETSRSRKVLMECLKAMNYDVTECLLSPVDFGIPNHRARYYMCARRRGPEDEAPRQDRPVATTWPLDGAPFDVSLPTLSTFLEAIDIDDHTYDVPARSILRLHNFRFDIVRPSDTRTSCVTKSYGSHHLASSGSLLQTKQMEVTEYQWHDPASLVDLGLRFLTPIEVASLHAFPLPSAGPLAQSGEGEEKPAAVARSEPRAFVAPSQAPYLAFPEEITTQQRYRLLGNSLNCWVVSELYRVVLFN